MRLENWKVGKKSLKAKVGIMFKPRGRRCEWRHDKGFNSQ